jgi:hypothetical protein
LPSTVYNSIAENSCLQPAPLQLKNVANNPVQSAGKPAENTAGNGSLFSRKYHLQF